MFSISEDFIFDKKPKIESFKESFEKNQFIIYRAVILFSFVDCIMVILQAKSTQIFSINYISANYLNLKKIFISLVYFLNFFAINLCFLCCIVFYIDYFLLKMGFSPVVTLFIMLFCIIFKIHTWVQSNIFYILGVFSYKQEFVELFFNINQIKEYNMNLSKDTIKQKYLNKFVQQIRQFVYKLFFNICDITFENIYFSEEYLKNHKECCNKRVLPDFLDFIFRLIIPHALTLLMNLNSDKSLNGTKISVVLKAILYIFLTFFRVYFLITIITYIASKTNIV